MASTNKTELLKLPQWQDNDKLEMTDLNDAFEKVDTGLTTHLADKAKQSEVNSLSASKADKSYVDTLVTGIASGSPIAVSLVAEMLNVTRNYVYTGSEEGYTFGNWYYWNGDKWVDGGTYQSTGIADNSITSNKLKGSVAGGKNLFNKEDVVLNCYMSSSTGEIINGSAGSGLNAISGYIPVDGTSYSHSHYANVLCYDANKVFLGGLAGGRISSPSEGRSRDLIEGTKFVRMSFKQSDIDVMQFESGNNVSEYEEYKYAVANLVVGDMGKNDNETLEKRIKTHGIMYLGNKAELYTEEDSTYGIFYLGLNNQKIAVIFVDSEKPRGTSSWDIEAIKDKYPEKVVTSPKGVENCIKLNPASVLYFDIMTRELIIEDTTYNNLLDKYIVLGVVNHYGNLIGGDLVHNNITPKRSIRNENKIEELYTDLSNTVGRLPVHFMEEVKDTVEKIENIASKPSLMLNILTDSHSDTFGDNFKYIRETSDNIRAVNQHNPSEGILHLGDFVTGAKAKTQTKESIRTVLTNLRKSNISIFPLRGNHDDNSYGDDRSVGNLIFHDEFYGLASRPTSTNPNVHRQDNKGYYYINYPTHKIRLVMLDSVDYPIIENETGGLVHDGQNWWGYSEEQIDWLGNVALKVDDTWSALVFSHTPTRAEHSLTGRLIPHRSEDVEGLLTAFKNGTTYLTYDFTGQGAKDLMGYIFGHTHMDLVDTPVDLGYPCISICNNTPSKIDTTVVPNGGVAYDRTVDTLSQDLWETLIVRQDERKLYLIRFGAGDDREINY